jgi:hypothetical protein
MPNPTYTDMAREVGAAVYSLADHGDLIEFTPAQLEAFTQRVIELCAVAARNGVEWSPGRSAEYREGYFSGLKDAETGVRSMKGA